MISNNRHLPRRRSSMFHVQLPLAYFQARKLLFRVLDRLFQYDLRLSQLGVYLYLLGLGNETIRNVN